MSAILVFLPADSNTFRPNVLRMICVLKLEKSKRHQSQCKEKRKGSEQAEKTMYFALTLRRREYVRK